MAKIGYSILLEMVPDFPVERFNLHPCPNDRMRTNMAVEAICSELEQ